MKNEIPEGFWKDLIKKYGRIPSGTSLMLFELLIMSAFIFPLTIGLQGFCESACLTPAQGVLRSVMVAVLIMCAIVFSHIVLIRFRGGNLHGKNLLAFFIFLSAITLFFLPSSINRAQLTTVNGQHPYLSYIFTIVYFAAFFSIAGFVGKIVADFIWSVGKAINNRGA